MSVLNVRGCEQDRILSRIRARPTTVTLGWKLLLNRTGEHLGVIRIFPQIPEVHLPSGLGCRGPSRGPPPALLPG